MGNFWQCDTMNIIRAKIIAFWLLFLVFCFLLVFAWSHRLLWLGFFLPALIILLLVKPRLSSPPPKLKLLFQMGSVVFVLAFVVHGFLFPYSASLYLVMKILCPLFLVPALCWKAYLDYVLFRTSHTGSA
jgi:hypothetical protein